MNSIRSHHGVRVCSELFTYFFSSGNCTRHSYDIHFSGLVEVLIALREDEFPHSMVVAEEQFLIRIKAQVEILTQRSLDFVAMLRIPATVVVMIIVIYVAEELIVVMVT